MNISQITSSINSFFSAINAKITKVVPMPAILLLCAAMSRQGLSPLRSLSNVCKALEELGIPREDSANGLPLGMMSKIVCKHNFRNLVDMSHQRECTRAYHEYRKLFKDICIALSEYSDEWKYLVENYFMPKCDVYGYCTEKKSCGRKDKKN